MPLKNCLLFWQEIEKRKSRIATDFNETLAILNQTRANATLLAELGLQEINIQDTIDLITITQTKINEVICNKGTSYIKATARKLCDDTQRFAQQLRYTVELATNKDFLRNTDENSIYTLEAEFNELHSRAKAGILSPIMQPLLKLIGGSLILPATIYALMAAVTSFAVFTSIAIPVLLPILILPTIIMGGLLYKALDEDFTSAKIDTSLRNVRIDMESRLRHHLFKPVAKLDISEKNKIMHRQQML